MAIFKKFNVTRKSNRYSAGETNTGVVINPSDGTLWIDSRPYDANTLYPIFEKPCTALLNNKVKEELVNGFIASALISKAPSLQTGQDTGNSLGGPIGFYSSMGSRDHNLEADQTLNMSSNVFSFTSTGGKNFHLIMLPYGVNNYMPYAQTYFLVEGNDFSNPDAVATGLSTIQSQSYHGHKYPVHVDTTNKYIYFISYHARYDSHSSYYFKTLAKHVTRASYESVEDNGSLVLNNQTTILSPNQGHSTTGGGYDDFEPNNFYYCGKNNDNTLMFLETHENSTSYSNQSSTFENRVDNIFTAESYNVTSGTVSTVATITKSNITTATAAVKVMLRARASQFIDSPINGETDICYAYYPVANESFEISFLYLQWNKSANSNAGSLVADNCSMTYATGTVTDYLTYPLTSANNLGAMTRSNLFITEVSGSYYLHYLPSYSSPEGTARQSATAKNMVTYQIDSADFSSLTFHSVTQVNAFDFVHLNSSRTKIAVVTSGALKIYTWNNGWSETASEAGDFVGVTQDSSGRIIGLSSKADNTTAAANSVDSNFAIIDHKVHLIADSLPSTVTVDFADSSLTYSGSNISTSVNVSAYNDASARIAKSVILKIDGANAQFTSNSGTSITITTTTLADTNVPVTVTGPGPITISASFSL